MNKPKFDGIEKYIFADVYMFLTEYINGDGSPAFWEQCVAESRKLCNKYNNNQLCVDLVVATLCDIEYKFTNTEDKYGRPYMYWEHFKSSIIPKK